MYSIKIHLRDKDKDEVIELSHVNPWQSLLELCLLNDIPIPHDCGGVCACSTCHIRIMSGDQYLEPKSLREEHYLRKITNIDPSFRLACQCVLTKDSGTIEVSVSIQ